MKCSKCSCEGDCRLLRKEIALLETLLRVEEATTDNLRESIQESYRLNWQWENSLYKSAILDGRVNNGEQN